MNLASVLTANGQHCCHSSARPTCHMLRWAYRDSHCRKVREDGGGEEVEEPQRETHGNTRSPPVARCGSPHPRPPRLGSRCEFLTAGVTRSLSARRQLAAVVPEQQGAR